MSSLWRNILIVYSMQHTMRNIKISLYTQQKYPLTHIGYRSGDIFSRGRDQIVNALLSCHDLVLSCCHEIARISVMQCSL